ncbi:MAG: ROK family protein, partial [Firmicutes bacterium]|nr:ROK family protein [Bacillota bacterium]
MYYIGVDLGGTNIAVGIVDENYKIVKKGSVPTLAQRPSEEIIKDMTDLSKKLLDECGISLDEVAYAGIAAPGSVDPENGVIEYTNNLPFRNFEIAKVFKQFLPVKEVYAENDANAAALGEAYAGAAKGIKDSIMITLGTGLGGGIIIDHKIYTGFNHYGGELGHVVLVYDGKQCTCGRKGCWETYSSATGLIN